MAEFHAAVTGYVQAHAGKSDGDAPSLAEAQAALAQEIAAGRRRA